MVRNDGITGRNLVGTKKIVLTFDDGPTEFTEALGGYLVAARVPATFFINGAYAVGDYLPMLSRLAQQGIAIGNHGQHHHALIDTMPEDVLKEEVLATAAVIRTVAPNQRETYFRPPFGIWSERAAAIFRSLPELENYTAPVLWTTGGDLLIQNDQVLGAADWDCWDHGLTPLQCFMGYRNDLERSAGGIVLLHFSHETLELTEMLVDYFRADGFEFVSLGEALREVP